MTTPFLQGYINGVYFLSTESITPTSCGGAIDLQVIYQGNLLSAI